MNLKNVYSVFTQIEKQSGKIAKETILKNNESNTDFLKALTFLLNQYIVTGISSKKISKDIPAKTKLKLLDDITYLKSLDEVITYVTENNTGKDVDILSIKTYTDSLINGLHKEFVEGLVTKSLKLGISEKTVNKVYGKDTIPTFAVMLAESFAKKQDKITGKFYVTLKLDGNRCVAINDTDGVKFFSRKGQPIFGMKNLEEQFKNLPIGWVYDGELLLKNEDELPSDELFRMTQKVVRKDGDKENLEFYVFDALPKQEFMSGKSNLKYSQRRNSLNTTFSITDGLVDVFLLPVLYEGSDKQVITQLLSDVEKQGYEGLMVNSENGLYQTKRVNDLQKVKSFKSADLVCLGIEEGAGRLDGTLGKILVEYKGGVTKVGTGFSDEDRKFFWNNPDEITGKIIEVKYFEESMDDKTKQVSLRFPVFVTVRKDKGIEDVNFGE